MQPGMMKYNIDRRLRDGWRAQAVMETQKRSEHDFNINNCLKDIIGVGNGRGKPKIGFACFGFNNSFDTLYQSQSSHLPKRKREGDKKWNR